VTVRLGDELLNIRAHSGFSRQVGERCSVRPTQGCVHLFDKDSGEALAKPGDRGASSAGHPATAGI